MVFISEEEIETLKQKLAEKDEKLKNQASELNHLTNEIIPDLKKENKQLKALKVELTDALETSTKKYFDQLEINADLSESVAKKGAGLQLAKVRLEEIEKLVVELEAKANENEVDCVTYTRATVNSEATFVIGNTPGSVLPATGGEGTRMIYLLGITLMVLAGAGLILVRRRKERAA